MNVIKRMNALNRQRAKVDKLLSESSPSKPAPRVFTLPPGAGKSRMDPLVDRDCAQLDGNCSCRTKTECKYAIRSVRDDWENGVMVIYDPSGIPPYNRPWWRAPFDGCFGDRKYPASMCSWVPPGCWPEWML